MVKVLRPGHIGSLRAVDRSFDHPRQLGPGTELQEMGHAEPLQGQQPFAPAHFRNQLSRRRPGQPSRCAEASTLATTSTSALVKVGGL